MMDSNSQPNCSKADNTLTKNKTLKSDRPLLIPPQDALKCGFCDYTTCTNSKLLVHVRVHTREKPYECQHPDCKAAFASSSSLNTHQLVHNKDDESLLKFRCSLCPYKTGWRGNLENHLKTHSEVRDFPCDLCPFRAKQKGGLISHRHNVHSGNNERPFKCPHANCRYAFKRKIGLSKHMLVHSDDKPFACSFAGCDFRTKWSGPLKTHEMAHRGENTFKCSLCTYLCNSKSSLDSHLRAHTGETPFSCSICPYRAKNRSNVTRHMKVHSNDQPFVCSIENCNFRTKHKSSFENHKLTHVEGKLFKCPFCPYSCNYKARLTCHIRVHTGEAPFACQNCAYRTKHSSELIKHTIKVHGKKKSNKRSTGAAVASICKKTLFKCKLVQSCDFSAGKEADLAIHLNEAHNLPRVKLVNKE